MNTVRVNQMFLNAETNEVEIKIENRPFGFVNLFDKFGADNFQVFDTGDIDRDEIPSAQNSLDNVVDNGIWYGPKLYIPIFASASEARKGAFMLCYKEIISEVLNWSGADLDLSRLTVGKQSKYLALPTSTVTPWEDIFQDGRMPHIDFESWGVFRDVDVPAIGEFDKTAIHTVERSLVLPDDGETNKISDGISYYVVDDESFEVGNLKALEAFSVRAPLIKGLFVPVLKSTLRAFIEKNGVSSVIKDYWGNEVDILNLGVISFGSVFKAAKCVKSWQEYCDFAKKYEHRVDVCVQAHHRIGSLPYQQLQTLDATKEEVEQLARKSAATLLDYTKVGSCGKILGGSLGKIADVYPELLKDNYVREQLQRTWLSKAKQMYGGRIAKCCRNLFCAPDTVAVLQGLFGLPITGIINAHRVITRAYDSRMELGSTRSPHLDHAWAVVRNMQIPEEYEGLFTGTTIYYSCRDNIMKLHQMDFDGDHSCVTDDPILVSIAKRSHEKYNDRCLLYAAMDSGKSSGCVDYFGEFNNACKNAFKAPIGLYANTLTKVWAERKPFASVRDKIAVVTRKCNTCIDEAGGHGADNSVGYAESVCEQYRLVPKPAFLSYAKGRISQDGRSIVKEPDGKYMYYRNSVVDQYSAVCRFLIPERAEDIIKLDALGDFQVSFLQKESIAGKNLTAKLQGLISDKEGFFNSLCAKTQAEETLIVETSSLDKFPNFAKNKGEAIETEVAIFANDRGVSLDDAVDYIAYCLFHKMKRVNFGASILKRWFFISFGYRVLANVLKNEGLKNDFVAEDYDLYDEDEGGYEE